MKLLDQLVLKDLVPNLLIGIGMFSSLFIALGPSITTSRLLSDGLPLALILKFFLYNTISYLGLTFPMGMLLSVLLGFGRLSADSETVALFAGGIPFLRAAAPAAALGLLVSGAAYVVNDPLASYADHQIVDMKRAGLHQLATVKPYDLPPRYVNGSLQATAHIEKGFDLRTGTLRQVTITIYDASSGQVSTVFYAQKARPLTADPETTEYQLDDVEVLSRNGPTSYLYTLRSRELPTTVLKQTPNTNALLSLIKDDPNALAFSKLRQAVAYLRRQGFGGDPDVRAADFALWSKIAVPLASVVFALVGAPLALRPQRTSKVTGWLLSLPIILVYYVLYSVMTSVARGGACPPLLAAFVPDIVGLLVGIGLVWKRSVS